jgi:hypothetical protein
MLGLVLVPVDIWRAPKVDMIYKGFNANLISINRTGFPLPESGKVNVLRNGIELGATPQSAPSIHLLTGRLSGFKVAMDVQILDAPANTVPLRLSLWSPRSKAGYSLTFGPGPSNPITSQLVANGAAAQTLVGGQVYKQEVLGSYNPGQTYHLDMIVDKKSGMLVRLTGRDAPPSNHPMLAIVGGPADKNYADIAADPVRVTGGKDYRFGGLLKVSSGSDAYKIVLNWLDKNGTFLGSAGGWSDSARLSGWSQAEFTARAPAKAAFAWLLLGAGNGTIDLFSDLSIMAANGNGTNLLKNGQLLDGAQGWSVYGKPSAKLELLDPHPVSFESRVTAEEAPQLFRSVNLTFTASASSSMSATSSAVLTDYSLTLPHQRYLAVKVADTTATALLNLLLVLGGLLVIARGIVWVWDSFASRRRRTHAARAPAQKRGFPRAFLVAVLLAIAVVIPNVLLFGVGREPYDMASQRIWAYVAAAYGPSQLYYLPNIVSTSHVWGGAPYGAAPFAYEPLLGYLFTAIGWVNRLFFSAPGGLGADTPALEFLIKLSNVLFCLADGLLIYLILRQLTMRRTSGLIGAGLFLFNPAVWFSMSVLGLTQVVSTFFALVAVWLAARKHPVAAWVALGLTSLARPQMLVLAFLLGLIFLRKFSLRENIRGAVWAVIFAFLLLGPFTLRTSPSLPIDVMANTLQVQEGGGNEGELTTVSVNAYSVWPLVTYVVGQESGLARIFHSSADRLAGPLTYQRVGTILTVALMLVLASLIAFRRRSQLGFETFLPILAAGLVGFLMLMTGIAAAHFVLALPFLIIARSAFGRIQYAFVLLVWTITALVPMYGSLGGYVAVFDPSSSNAISRFFMNLYSWDSFISVATIANTLVLVLCLVATLRVLVSKTQPESTALGSFPVAIEPVAAR